tara:strand:- start:179 stop:388 length:210 start_codon:yes stop_codon:yes gene_type:complete
MMRIDKKIVDEIARKSIEISSASSDDIDRSCWVLLHEYIHGFRPSEYDIRDIDEDRYLEILQRAKEMRD